MNIISNILTTNNCYKTGRKMAKVKGLMIHSVGCPQPDAQVFMRLWAQNVTTVCPHGIIDSKGIYQTLPWDHYGWHACDPANASYIGVETTEPATISYQSGTVVDSNPTASKAHIDAVYKQSVQLFAYLCQFYKLDPLTPGVVISHNEGRLMGIASAHVDPDHLWTRYGYTMDGFRKDVKAAMGAPKPSPSPAPKTIEQLAIEVIRGKWACDPERTKKLTAAGYDAKAVQARVNELMHPCAPAPTKSIDEIAREVIQGKWGAGAERKKLLTQAGYDYIQVQNRVNEILR